MVKTMSTSKEAILAAAATVDEAGFLGIAELMRGWAGGKGIKAWAVTVKATDSYGGETGENVTLETKIDKKAAEQSAFEYNCKLVAQFTEEHDWPRAPTPGDKYGWGGATIHPRGYENFVAFMKCSTVLLDNLNEANGIVDAVAGTDGSVLDENPDHMINPDLQRQAIIDAFVASHQYGEKSFQAARVVETTIG